MDLTRESRASKIKPSVWKTWDYGTHFPYYVAIRYGCCRKSVPIVREPPQSHTSFVVFRHDTRLPLGVFCFL